MAVTKKLYRSCKDKILGGVAGGLGEYLEIDPTLIRLIIALSFIMGFGFLAYLLAWIIIPVDPSCNSKKTAAEEIKEQAEKVAEDIKKATNTKDNSKTNTRFWFGIIILFFAFSLLTQNLLGYDLWHNFWPFLLVAFGVILISGSFDKK